ncbi:MAG TPA: fumarylacetoacetate hydrolase family protein [Steroidobacteraceae bacterium]|nr:fumarylacetoacetate hydrolase family protein [Steroidobacteraceae bacterium]
MQEQYAVPAVPRPTVAVQGGGPRFPVRRIFCVGRNYPEHAREMGFQDRAPPFFFSKPADAVMPSGSAVPYPPRTLNLHHEIELVVALGRGGRDVLVGDALELVFGYAVGNDLTRRDVQAAAKDAGRPWDTAKGFDHAAPVSRIAPAMTCGHPASGRIWLEVNGELRQQGDLADMIWSVPEVIAELSTWFELAGGDLVFTGTPAGVGPLVAGDRVRGGVDGVGILEHTVAAR